MRDLLTDIQEKLQDGKYKNEEHVRLALVCRLLHKLGWNIWDPEEVNTEFPTIPSEDRTKVDIALFANKTSPSIFIEAKAVGKVEPNLSDIERQVRDYNRNNTALFSVITDGRVWRFYYSQTGGEFHHKCFKKCDLLEGDLEDIEQTFSLFLRKENILNGRAEEQARKYLQLTKMQRVARDCLPHARRLVQSPPYLTVPQALVNLMKEKGFPISEEEARKLLKRLEQTPEPSPPPRPEDDPNRSQHKKPIVELDPDNPGDLTHAKVEEGTICGERGRNWNDLVRIGIRLAVQKGYDAHFLDSCLPANIKEGIHTTEGYTPIEDLDLSVQGMQANKAVKTLCLLAKKLNCHLELTVSWYGKSPRAGKRGIIRWPP